VAGQTDRHLWTKSTPGDRRVHSRLLLFAHGYSSPKEISVLL
jgi:hypothetical protein